MSVNETATQNVWQHHFPEPGGGGGWLWDKLANREVEKQHFMNLTKMIDSSLSPVTHIWVTLSDFFLHILP